MPEEELFVGPTLRSGPYLIDLLTRVSGQEPVGRVLADGAAERRDLSGHFMRVVGGSPMRSSKTKHVEENAGAMKLTLSLRELERLDVLSRPFAGGTKPFPW